MKNLFKIKFEADGFCLLKIVKKIVAKVKCVSHSKTKLEIFVSIKHKNNHKIMFTD